MRSTTNGSGTLPTNLAIDRMLAKVRHFFDELAQGDEGVSSRETTHPHVALVQEGGRNVNPTHSTMVAVHGTTGRTIPEGAPVTPLLLPLANININITTDAAKDTTKDAAKDGDIHYAAKDGQGASGGLRTNDEEVSWYDGGEGNGGEGKGGYVCNLRPGSIVVGVVPYIIEEPHTMLMAGAIAGGTTPILMVGAIAGAGREGRPRTRGGAAWRPRCGARCRERPRPVLARGPEPQDRCVHQHGGCLRIP